METPMTDAVRETLTKACGDRVPTGRALQALVDAVLQIAKRFDEVHGGPSDWKDQVEETTYTREQADRLGISG